MFISWIEVFSQRMGPLFVVSLLVVGLLHFEAFRTMQGLFLPLVTAILSVFWGLGLMGIAKVPMDAFNAVTPILILAITAGHAVQLLKRYYEEYEPLARQGMDLKQANSQAVVARSLAPLLRDGQVILLIQGNTGGSLIVRRALDDAGCQADVDVAEMDNYPYSCWRLAPTRIRPIVRKRWLQIATFPGNRIAAVFPRLSGLFPQAIAAPNILHTGFTNANAMLHVANCVANAGRIESGDSYRFYADGVTRAVARLYEAINAERVAVAAALGASVPTLADWFDRVYGVRGATLVETCQRLTYNSDGPYQPTGTPKSLDHKFITEDVPTGLIPMSALGAAAAVRTPAIDALVEVVRSMTGKDFAAGDRTLEHLGIGGMDTTQIGRVVDEGFC